MAVDPSALLNVLPTDDSGVAIPLTQRLWYAWWLRERYGTQQARYGYAPPEPVTTDPLPDDSVRPHRRPLVVVPPPAKPPLPPLEAE